MGVLFHAIEEKLLYYSHMIDNVLSFKAAHQCINLRDNSVIGKVNEILRLIKEGYFSVKVGKGRSQKRNKVYVVGDNLLR